MALLVCHARNQRYASVCVFYVRAHQMARSCSLIGAADAQLHFFLHTFETFSAENGVTRGNWRGRDGEEMRRRHEQPTVCGLHQYLIIFAYPLPDTCKLLCVHKCHYRDESVRSESLCERKAVQTRAAFPSPCFLRVWELCVGKAWWKPLKILGKIDTSWKKIFHTCSR